MRKTQKRYIFLVAIIAVLLFTMMLFFLFAPVGYCMSIRFREFTEVEHNIFINNNYSYVTANDNGELVGKVNIPSIVNEARSRVATFFGGELQSDSVFIFSDNDKTINKTGDRHAYSFTLFNSHSHIAISYRYIKINKQMLICGFDYIGDFREL